MQIWYKCKLWYLKSWRTRDAQVSQVARDSGQLVIANQIEGSEKNQWKSFSSKNSTRWLRGGETGSMYVLSYQVCFYIHIYIYITLWYGQIPWSSVGTCMYLGLFRGTCTYLYEHFMCRYIRLNALNVLHVHEPCFNAPEG